MAGIEQISFWFEVDAEKFLDEAKGDPRLQDYEIDLAMALKCKSAMEAWLKNQLVSDFYKVDVSGGAMEALHEIFKGLVPSSLEGVAVSEMISEDIDIDPSALKVISVECLYDASKGEIEEVSYGGTLFDGEEVDLTVSDRLMDWNEADLDDDIDDVDIDEEWE
jgi:hypothetical protein